MNPSLSGSTGGNPPADQDGIKKQLLKGILFWERGRWLFNLGLVCAVLFWWIERWSNAQSIFSGPRALDLLKSLGWLNLAYFAGYLMEILLLIPRLRLWSEALRWTILGIGIALGFFLLYIHMEMTELWLALGGG